MRAARANKNLNSSHKTTKRRKMKTYTKKHRKRGPACSRTRMRFPFDIDTQTCNEQHSSLTRMKETRKNKQHDNTEDNNSRQHNDTTRTQNHKTTRTRERRLGALWLGSLCKSPHRCLVFDLCANTKHRTQKIACLAFDGVRAITEYVQLHVVFCK